VSIKSGLRVFAFGFSGAFCLVCDAWTLVSAAFGVSLRVSSEVFGFARVLFELEGECSDLVRAPLSATAAALAGLEVTLSSDVSTGFAAGMGGVVLAAAISVLVLEFTGFAALAVTGATLGQCSQTMAPAISARTSSAPTDRRRAFALPDVAACPGGFVIAATEACEVVARNAVGRADGFPDVNITGARLDVRPANEARQSAMAMTEVNRSSGSFFSAASMTAAIPAGTSGRIKVTGSGDSNTI